MTVKYGNLSQSMVKIPLPKMITLFFHLKSSPVLPKCLLNTCSLPFAQERKPPGTEQLTTLSCKLVNVLLTNVMLPFFS